MVFIGKMPHATLAMLRYATSVSIQSPVLLKLPVLKLRPLWSVLRVLNPGLLELLQGEGHHLLIDVPALQVFALVVLRYPLVLVRPDRDRHRLNDQLAAQEEFILTREVR